MFKRTLVLLNQGKPVQDGKHKKILDYFTPNDHIVEKIDKMPYELRGEYLPRQKQNPFKKRPMNVVYDVKDFTSYVLPSKRDTVYGLWGMEELFGIKRWRNDSPFMKEYIKVDNQIFLIVCLSLVLISPFFWIRQRQLERDYDNYITSGYGKFKADDLI